MEVIPTNYWHCLVAFGSIPKARACRGRLQIICIEKLVLVRCTACGEGYTFGNSLRRYEKNAQQACK
jgi:hypothetical protein